HRSHNSSTERKRLQKDSHSAVVVSVLTFLRDNLKPCGAPAEQCMCADPPKQLLDWPVFRFVQSVVEDTWKSIQLFINAPKQTAIKTYKIEYHTFCVAYLLRFGIQDEKGQTILPGV